jgi:hypothetical protein
MVMESFETWRERSSAINPARRALIDSMEIELRAAFIGLGDARADGVHFDQVIRVNLLERV